MKNSTLVKLVFFGILTLLVPVILQAQARDSLFEAESLRSALRQEIEGNFAEAEKILKDVMNHKPTSTEGLFALERMFRSQGRIKDIFPIVQRYQDSEPYAAIPRIVMLRAFEELNAVDELKKQWSAAEILPSGSIDRRHVLAEIIRLEIARNDVDVQERFGQFRSEFPDASEVDELAVMLAVKLESKGDDMAARSLLASVERSKVLLERGYLYLASGEVVPGRSNLRKAVSGLPPTEATNVISLIGLLEKLKGKALIVVMRSAILEHRGQANLAASEIKSLIEGIPLTDQPAVLAYSARIADNAELRMQASEFRYLLVHDHPNAAETPEATLDLVRFKGIESAGVEESIQLLEDLIVRHPDNAIVPIARRELGKLKDGKNL